MHFQVETMKKKFTIFTQAPNLTARPAAPHLQQFTQPPTLSQAPSLSKSPSPNLMTLQVPRPPTLTGPGAPRPPGNTIYFIYKRGNYQIY